VKPSPPPSDVRRLSVMHILRGPMNFESVTPAADFDFGADGPRYEDGIRITGNVTIVDDQVITQVKLKGREIAACSRCLEDVERPLDKDLFLAFELTKERTIDLLPYLREEMLLEQPIQVLCRPNCKGLCARCGANLNKRPCGCAKRP
jgi:uncharacterized protein